MSFLGDAITTSIGSTFPRYCIFRNSLLQIWSATRFVFIELLPHLEELIRTVFTLNKTVQDSKTRETDHES